MKKTLILLIMIVFAFILLPDLLLKKNILPEESIRMRIIPNSDSKSDQKIKNKIKFNLENDILKLLNGVENIEESRRKIKDNLFHIENTVKNTLNEENINYDYSVNFGYNYFPEKTYNGLTYKEGEYESLVVTLGEGNGSNWWCVLFPPLCLVEADESDEVEYKIWIEEMMEKYF